MNVVCIQGRLGSDPEGGESGQGVSYATFSVAIEKGSGDAKTVMFLDCVAFRQQADFVKTYCHKGDAICISGSISVRDWEEPQSGVKRRKFEIVVSQVQFSVSGKSRGSGGGYSGRTPRNGGAPVAVGVGREPMYEEPY